jgi:hypothetical protein
MGLAKRIAYRMVTAQAVTAAVTRDMMGDKDAVPGSVAAGPFSYAGDFTGDFVTQHEGCLLGAVPLHHVSAADAAGHNAHQQLSGPDGGNRHLLQAHVSIIVIHRDTHKIVPRIRVRYSSPWLAFSFLIIKSSTERLQQRSSCHDAKNQIRISNIETRNNIEV